MGRFLGLESEVSTQTTGRVLRGAGDTGLIGTMTVGVAITKIVWRTTLDFGLGRALLSQWKLSRQNVGGPFQFIVHGGILFHLPWNLMAGYRFHHMSDGMIYGSNRGVDLHMLEVRY